MTAGSFGDRVRRRLEREADALVPLVDAARSHPVARQVRRTVTSAQMGLKVKLGDPDLLLDRIVARAIEPPPPAENDRTPDGSRP